MWRLLVAGSSTVRGNAANKILVQNLFTSKKESGPWKDWDMYTDCACEDYLWRVPQQYVGTLHNIKLLFKTPLRSKRNRVTHSFSKTTHPIERESFNVWCHDILIYYQYQLFSKSREIYPWLIINSIARHLTEKANCIKICDWQLPKRHATVKMIVDINCYQVIKLFSVTPRTNRRKTLVHRQFSDKPGFLLLGAKSKVFVLSTKMLVIRFQKYRFNW